MSYSQQLFDDQTLAPKALRLHRAIIVQVCLMGVLAWLILVMHALPFNLGLVIPLCSLAIACVYPAPFWVTAALTLGVHWVNLRLWKTSLEAIPNSWSIGSVDDIILIVTANIIAVSIVSAVLRLVAGTRHAGVAGLVLKTFGIGMVLVAPFSWIVWQGGEGFIIVAGINLLLAGLGGAIFYRGKQYAAVSSRMKLAKNTAAPVLYLRAFHRDVNFLGSVLQYLFLPFSITAKNAEQEIADAVAPVGPLIALGRPDDRLPPPGAHRVYLRPNNWRESVERLMFEAALVIIQIDKGGEGLQWELAKVREVVLPERAIFLSFLAPEDLQHVRLQFETETGLELPKDSIASPYFIWDSGTGAPQKNQPLRGWPSAPGVVLASNLRYALSPVFERIDVDWSPPSALWPWMKWVGFTLLLFIPLAVARVVATTQSHHANVF